MFKDQDIIDKAVKKAQLSGYQNLEDAFFVVFVTPSEKGKSLDEGYEIINPQLETANT